MTFGTIRPSPKWGHGRRSEYLAKKRYKANVIRVILVIGSLVLLTAKFSPVASSFSTDYQGVQFSSRQLLQSTISASATATTSNVTTPSAHDHEDHTPPWERCDYEKDHYGYAWVVFYAFLILVSFIALAIICDDFFVPSLEVISEKLELSEDVAGATFMAAGSSAPELFTSVAGVAQETDVGVGTIVGSAVFNILIIIALSAALAGKVLNLDWRPLARDSIFYALSIACFIGFSWDAKVEVWEAVILLVLYIIYIIVMKFNVHLMKLMEKCTCACCRAQVVPIDAETGVEGETDTTNVPADDTPVKQPDSENNLPNSKDTLPPLKKDRKHSVISVQSTGSGQKHIFHHVKHGELSGNFTSSQGDLKSSNVVTTNTNHTNGSIHYQEHVAITDANKRPSIAVTNLELTGLDLKKSTQNADTNAVHEEKDDDKDKEEEEEEVQLYVCPCLPPLNMTFPDIEEARQNGCCCGWVKYFFKWILFVISFPFMCMFTWTIPNCGKPHLRRWFMVSFFMSVIWIALLSFAMVTVVQRMGCILNINDFVMGILIVAVGTSVPDAMSSILVARDGFGDMAVSNAIGSNVFDINLGLGLPFVIRIAIDHGAAIHLFEEGSELENAFLNGEMVMTPHVKFGFILLLILVMTMVVFGCARFRLNKWIGVCFVTIYILFIIYALIQEFICDGYKC
ncbi:sodium/potassium/calcium exchanger 3-like isoform X2 [Ptychodera flava]